jgi:hypothetical protein
MSSKRNDIIEIDERKFGIDTERHDTINKGCGREEAPLGWVNYFSNRPKLRLIVFTDQIRDAHG